MMRRLFFATSVLAVLACTSPRDVHAALLDDQQVRAVPASAPVAQPWVALDLGALRLREAGVKAPAARPAAFPQGLVEIEGVPFSFASAKETWEVAARGQRIAFAPVEGGRYYDLALACSFSAAAERVTFALLGPGGETREFGIDLGPEEAGASYRVVRVPVAAPFPIDALRLPADERLHVHAVTLRWVTEGPGNAKFRRAFFAASSAEPALQRYLRTLAEGGPTRDAAVEEPFERALFDHYLDGRTAAALRLVELRLALVAQRAQDAQRDHLHVCLVVSPRGGEERIGALRQLVALLDANPELAGAIGGLEPVRLLEHRAPEEFQKLDALVKSGRLEIAGVQTHLDWETPPGEQALATAFDQGMKFAAEHGWEKLARPALLGDPSSQPRFPDDCVARGLVRGALWSDGVEAGVVPHAFGLRSASGSGVILVHVPAARADFSAAALAADLEHARTGSEMAELFCTLAVDESGASARTQLQLLREFGGRDSAPRMFFDTPARFLDELRKSGRFQPALWTPRAGIDLGTSRLAPLALRSANRRAEVELESAARAGAFAEQDGLSFLHLAFAEFESALHASFARMDPAALATAQAVAREAHARGLESLAVLARTAKTQGEGEALVVFNPLPFERTGLVEVEGRVARVLDPEGASAPLQDTAEGGHVLLARVPGLGHAVFHLLPDAQGAEEHAATRVEGVLANTRLALKLDEKTGEIASLRALPEGIELLGGASGVLAWLPEGAAAPLEERARLRSIATVEDGAVRLVVRLVFEIAGGSVTEELSLERDRPEVRVSCRAEGLRERGTLLAGFTLRAQPTALAFDSGGACSLLDPAGRDPFVLLPLRRFVSATDGDFGVALLSADAARFGAGGNRLVLELTQGGGSAPQTSSFALRPCVEEGSAADLATAADDLAYPLLALRAESHAGLRPARHTYLGVARDSGSRLGVELVELRPCADGLQLFVRERSGAAGELVLEPARALFGASLLDARTGEPSALECEKSRLHVPLRARQDLHLRLRLRP